MDNGFTLSKLLLVSDADRLGPRATVTDFRIFDVQNWSLKLDLWLQVTLGPKMDYVDRGSLATTDTGCDWECSERSQ
jgi:hypothetical protein